MCIKSLLKGMLSAVAFVAVAGFVYAHNTSSAEEMSVSLSSRSSMDPKPPVEIRAMVALEEVITRVRLYSPEDKVRTINAFLNQIPYVTDMAMWGVEDRWSMPYEFLATGAGDSEDFAIAKFYALWASGIAADQMSLAVSLHPLMDEEHVVLLVNLPGSEKPLVLDSLTYDLEYLDDRPELLLVRTLESQLFLPRMKSNRDQLLEVVIDWRMSQGQDVIAKFSM